MQRMHKDIERIFWGFILILLALWLVINLQTITHWLMPEPPYQEIEAHLAEYHR